jgi:hypothetical protein
MVEELLFAIDSVMAAVWYCFHTRLAIDHDGLGLCVWKFGKEQRTGERSGDVVDWLA